MVTQQTLNLHDIGSIPIGGIMQKFNIGEMVRSKTDITLPAQVVCIQKAYLFGDVSRLRIWAEVFSEEDVLRNPVYTIEFPRITRLLTYEKFLERYNLARTDKIEQLYKETTDSSLRVCVPECNLELVAYSFEEWLESFEDEESFAKFLDKYSMG